MSDAPLDHELTVHADEAKDLGRVFDVVALRSPNGNAPSGNALEAARSTALGEKGTLSAYAAEAVVPGAEPAGVILTVRQGPSFAKEVGTAAARATGLVAGVATSEGHVDLSLDDLVTVALEGLGVARADGAGHAVHSELYDLVEILRGRSPRPIEYGASASGAATDAIEPRWIPRPEHSAFEDDSPIAHQGPNFDRGQDSTAFGRGKRVESDDPFAHIDTDDRAITNDRATALAKAIAPGPIELLELARTHIEERDALRAELEAFRSDEGHSLPNSAPRLDVQERRIQKLLRELEGAEAEIKKLRMSKDTAPGLASFFRSAQGLDPNEPGAQAKRKMLETVFRQNQDDHEAEGSEDGPRN